MARQNRATLGRGTHRSKPLGHRLIEPGGTLDQFDIPDQDCQQVVEIVCYAARQLAHCFDPLGLPQRRFRSLALGHLFA